MRFVAIKSEEQQALHALGHHASDHDFSEKRPTAFPVVGRRQDQSIAGWRGCNSTLVGFSDVSLAALGIHL